MQERCGIALGNKSSLLLNWEVNNMQNKKNIIRYNRYNVVSYNIMLFPAMAFLAVFSIYPLMGSILAFKTFDPILGIWGSPWVGLENFIYIFQTPNIYKILYNTVFISLRKMIFNLVIPLIFALMLNEVKKRWYKKTVQTITYLPYFLSWVILAGMFKDIFSTTGFVNGIIGKLFGTEPIMFFANNTLFPYLMVTTDVWKSYGFNVIIYLAALTSIDVGIYEASTIDGASRWKQLRYITLPCLTPTIILLSTLSLQTILNAGFEQILCLYNPLVYDSSDILDTYIYRMGLIDNQFEFATAIGLMKSAISFFLIYITNKMADKYANYRIF
jgi:putative aldouronate transport system permease protein